MILPPVLIGVLQNKPIEQYTPSANTAETSGPAIWQGTWPALLQNRALLFCKSLLGMSENNIPKAVCMFDAGALFGSFAQLASSPLSAPIFGPTAY